MELKKEQIDQLKKLELEMLACFIDICKAEKLQYFAAGGTALGAVRHGGFIPWDDDIDVAMPRNDYDRFLEIAPKQLPQHLFLQHLGSETNCPYNFAKIRNSRTTFVERSCKDLKIHHGVYIDIFPLDGYPDCRLTAKLRKIKKTLLTIRVSRLYYFENKETSLRNKIADLVTGFLYGDSYSALKHRERLYRRYSYEDCETVCNYSGAWGEKEIAPKKVFGKGCKGTFEGMEIMLPEDVDKYLTLLYGDYMTPPPVEKRVPHHYTQVVDLEKPYTDYI